MKEELKLLTVADLEFIFSAIFYILLSSLKSTMKSITQDINFESLQREIEEAEDYLVRRSVNRSINTADQSGGNASTV